MDRDIESANNWLYQVWPGLRPLFGLYWRFRLEGAVDAVPTRGPLIVAANHASFLDPWLLSIVFPRDVRFLVTRNWYYKNRRWERFFAAQGCLPVMETPDATLRMVCRVLERGDVVGIFPEGRISADGRLRRFRAGITYIAARSGAPVLPVGIKGAFEILPRSRRVPRPGPLSFRFGRPLRFPGAPMQERPGTREVSAFRDVLADRLAELSGQNHEPELLPGAAELGRG